MSRRSLTLIIAFVATVAALAVAVLVPVPYVILGPGPTLNTLGKDASGKPLLTVSGHRTYPTTGHLNMVTVSYMGGPGMNINIFQALQSWLSSDEAVVPESELFPPGQSAKETQQQDTAQMTGSQQTAQAAAFSTLHIPFTTHVAIAAVLPHTPAAGTLKTGDQVLSVDGAEVTGQTQMTHLITSHPAGSALKLSVRRKDKTMPLTVTTKKVDGRAVMGVEVTEQFKFPFDVRFTVGDIGGPSAGMMFALGIIDKLTPGSLTDGKFIAGTGEITSSGQVQPIGGIQQKMAGARSAGARVFLAPAGNCRDVRGAIPAGLKVVKVATLSQAMSDLQALQKGHAVPSC
ncbi:MAG: PDZ domain-containing protein [Streptosporangiales bacterium]|nr:PDZ domain-containing protein [Streptosporangiales bacterium]